MSSNSYRANGIDVFDGMSTVEGGSIDWSSVEGTEFYLSLRAKFQCLVENPR